MLIINNRKSAQTRSLVKVDERLAVGIILTESGIKLCSRSFVSVACKDRDSAKLDARVHVDSRADIINSRGDIDCSARRLQIIESLLKNSGYILAVLGVIGSLRKIDKFL